LEVTPKLGTMGHSIWTTRTYSAVLPRSSNPTSRIVDFQTRPAFLCDEVSGYGALLLEGDPE